jgi:tau tubulin kinase
MLDSLGKILL